MKRFVLGQLLGLCLLGPVLLAGCSHTSSQNAASTSLQHTPVPQGRCLASAANPNHERSPAVVAQPVPMSTLAVSQVPDDTMLGGPKAVAQSATPSPQPSVVQVAHSQPAPELTAKAPAAAPATPALPRLGHAEDYRWLAGPVEHTRLSGGWRLRYASVAEEDQHGGSVTLSGDSGLARLTDGQFIRVQGHLLKPGDATTAPVYHVDSWEPVTGSSN